MATLKTIKQRGVAFIVQLPGEHSLGLARVFDTSMLRLHAPYPLNEIESNEGWEAPSRQIDDSEIAEAERLDEPPVPIMLRQPAPRSAGR